MQEVQLLSQKELRKIKAETKEYKNLLEKMDDYRTNSINEAILEFRHQTKIINDLVAENDENSIWIFNVGQNNYGLNDKDIQTVIQTSREENQLKDILDDELKIIEKASAYLRWQEINKDSGILTEEGPGNYVFCKSEHATITTKHFLSIKTSVEKLINTYKRSIN